MAKLDISAHLHFCHFLMFFVLLCFALFCFVIICNHTLMTIVRIQKNTKNTQNYKKYKTKQRNADRGKIVKLRVVLYPTDSLHTQNQSHHDGPVSCFHASSTVKMDFFVTNWTPCLAEPQYRSSHGAKMVLWLPSSSKISISRSTTLIQQASSMSTRFSVIQLNSTVI